MLLINDHAESLILVYENVSAWKSLFGEVIYSSQSYGVRNAGCVLPIRYEIKVGS